MRLGPPGRTLGPVADSQDERSSAIAARARPKRRRIVPALLLGLVGLVLGIPFGLMSGSLLAALVYCRGEGLPAGESCGMASIVLSMFGALIGAIVGAGIGVFLGLRRPSGTLA